MIFTCPVCFFGELPYPPDDYNICPCCGTEFENDDVEFTYDDLRLMWLATGARWFDGVAPVGWNAWVQLASASYGVWTQAASVRAPNTADIRGAGLVFQLA